MRRFTILVLVSFFVLPFCFAEKKIWIPMESGSVEIQEEEDYEDVFSLKDANNDGYLDIVQYQPLRSGTGGWSYMLYIYNPSKKCFDKGRRQSCL